jgi:hypothetical protein
MCGHFDGLIRPVRFRRQLPCNRRNLCAVQVELSQNPDRGRGVLRRDGLARYAAWQAYKRAGTAADRLARLVRQLNERLDRMP